MFTIWFVDDKMHYGLQKAAEWALGDYAKYKTFRNPNQPIDECASAARDKKSEILPHVFAIDLNFDSAPPHVPMDKISKHAVGFIIAAEYRHYARELNRSDVIDVLYTANFGVLDTYGDICKETPYGHDNLIKVVSKGDVNMLSESDIIGWVRERCVELACQRLKSGRVSVTESTINRLRQYLWTIEERSQEYTSVIDTISAPVKTIVEKLSKDWLQALNVQDHMSSEVWLATYGVVSAEALRRNYKPRSLRDAMNKCDGSVYNNYKDELRHTVDHYEQGLRKSGLAVKYSSVLKDTRCMLECSTELTDVAQLFPFHAQEIATAFTPSAAIASGKEILSFLEQELDHNRSIARLFKSMKVSPIAEEQPKPTTIWAYACHSTEDWKEPNSAPTEAIWPYTDKIAIPVGNDDEMEKLLEQEVGWNGSYSRDIVQVALPHRYIEWLRKMGDCENRKRIADDKKVRPPFISFIKGIDRYDLTCPDLEAYFKERFSLSTEQIEVIHSNPHSRNRRVISNWDYLTEIFKSLIETEKTTIKCLKSVIINYLGDRDNASVKVELSYDLKKYIGPLQIGFENGTLSGRLASFLGWGELCVITNTKCEKWECVWPGGKPHFEDVSEEHPYMKLILTMPNYLQRRCCLENHHL